MTKTCEKSCEKCNTISNCGKRCNKKQNEADLPLLRVTENVIRNDNPFNIFATTFRGLSPPDPILAVGPDRIVTAVNRMVKIMNKETMEVLFFNKSSIFFTNSPLNQNVSLGGNGGNDPWIVYDQFSKRFWIVTFSTTGGAAPSQWWFSVSKDSSPNTRDDWYHYYFVTNVIDDFPKIAVDKEAVYMVSIMGTFGAFFTKTYIFDKKPLVKGQLPQFPTAINPDQIVTRLETDFPFPIQPRLSHGKNHKKNIDKVLFVSPINTTPSFGVTGNIMRISYIKNPLTNPEVISVDVEVSPYFIPGGVLRQIPQPLPPFNNSNVVVRNIDSTPPGTIAGDLFGGKLVTAQVVDSGRLDSNGFPIKVTRWYEFDVKRIFQGKVKLIQNGNVDPGNNDNIWNANIAIDKDGNIGIAFSLAGMDKFVQIAYTGRLFNDPKGTVRLPITVVIASDLSYQLPGSPIPFIRWGDYSGLVVDPCDNKTFWLCNMYPVPSPINNPARQPPPATPDFPFNSNWATAIAAFRIDKGCSDTPTYPQQNNLVLS